MVLGFRKSSTIPVAIDFGYSSLKILQADPGSESTIQSAGCIEIPVSIRNEPSSRQEFLMDSLPKLLNETRIKSKIAICSIPAWQTFTQHLHIAKSDTSDISKAIIEQLQGVILCDPGSIVVRHIVVGDTYCDGQSRLEVICYAVGREIVMRQVELLKKAKLEVGGLHAEPVAVLKAFDHIYRREGDENTTTLYLDIGCNSTKVMIAHGTDLKFCRSVQIGGRHLDSAIASALHCDEATAYNHRMEEIRQTCQSQFANQANSFSGESLSSNKAGAILSSSVGGTENTQSQTEQDNHRKPLMQTIADRRHGNIPGVFNAVDGDNEDTESKNTNSADQSTSKSEAPEEPKSLVHQAMEPLLEQLSDEIKMSCRYHERIFNERVLDRVVFLGGESRDPAVRVGLAKRLGTISFLGDPLKRMVNTNNATLVGLDTINDQPGWAVAVGLCGCSLETQ